MKCSPASAPDQGFVIRNGSCRYGGTLESPVAGFVSGCSHTTVSVSFTSQRPMHGLQHQHRRPPPPNKCHAQTSHKLGCDLQSPQAQTEVSCIGPSNQLLSWDILGHFAFSHPGQKRICRGFTNQAPESKSLTQIACQDRSASPS